MSTQIRPETSQKNPYWIPKHRYYELKHFVMQYPAWVAARNGLDFLHTPTYCVRVKKDAADPTIESIWWIERALDADVRSMF